MLKLLVFASAIALALGDAHVTDCDSAEANSCAECLCAFDMSCGSEQQEWCDANLMGCVGYLSCPDVDALLADAGLSMDQVMAMVASMGVNAMPEGTPLLLNSFNFPSGSGSFQMPSGLGNMLGGMADMMGDMMGDMTDMLGGANLDLLQAGLQAARAQATAQGCSRRQRQRRKPLFVDGIDSDVNDMMGDMMGGLDDMMNGLASGFGAMGTDITSMMADSINDPAGAPDCATLLAAVTAGESAVMAAGGTIGDASGASAVTATMAGVVVVVAAMLF